MEPKSKKTSKDYKLENLKALSEAKAELEIMLRTMKKASKNTKEK